MTDFSFPADIGIHTVPARPCGQPVTVAALEPQHPRPTGVRLTMPALYAVDYGVEGPGGAMVDMDLRPFLDTIAAQRDGCEACFEHHSSTAGASPALTVHVVGVVLSGLGIDAATARQLLLKLDPGGAAIALTIRNHGLLAAVKVAERLGSEGRGQVVARAVNAMTSSGWYDSPVSNLCPPATQPRVGGLGDEEVLANLREGGYLP